MLPKRPATAESALETARKRPAAAEATPATARNRAKQAAKIQEEPARIQAEYPGAAGPSASETFLQEKQQFLDLAQHTEELLKTCWDGLRQSTAITEVRKAFAKGSEQLRGDRESALIAVTIGGAFFAISGFSGGPLGACSDELRDDPEVVLAAVPTNPRAVEFGSDRLQHSKEFVIAAVSRAGFALRYVREEFRRDREVVLAAVAAMGSALQYADESLHGDREIVLAAIESFPRSLIFASPAMKADKDIVMRALTLTWKEGCALGYSVLAEADDALKNDREVVLTAAIGSPQALKWASEELKADKDFVLTCVRSVENHHADCYLEASETVKGPIPWEMFERACKSSLAVAGQDAPVLSVAMTPPPKIGNLFDGTSDSVFRCTARLLSGAFFACDVRGEGRPIPTINDLARELVLQLPNHSEIESATHVFVVIETSSGETRSVTPFDGERPLSEFVSEI
mmetsp:Transcript_74863/g.163402  ORF Transcript_74863/g.163402 Transcript_74863/m.163402 type:complete len:459 (+) Transcript_74863:193-1569(+)